jgi:ribosomal protein L37AE/L43A
MKRGCVKCPFCLAPHFRGRVGVWACGACRVVLARIRSLREMDRRATSPGAPADIEERIARHRERASNREPLFTEGVDDG